MNDEQFEALVSNIAPENVQAFLRARDTAQREALARVEAELRQSRLCELGKDTELKHAQAQLAEAVGLLQQQCDKDRYGANTEHVEAFLGRYRARHAQSEQQEARNAEVARESLRPENQRIQPVEPLRVPHPLEAQGAQAGDERYLFNHWMHDLVHASEVDGRVRKIMRMDTMTAQEEECAWDAWQARAALATQPAVRGAEHDQ